jgi:hypothetical protein
MFIVRKKREHALLLYLLKSNKKKVAKLHVFRAPKNSHVGDVALLAFRQYFDSSPTTFIECQQHHAERAGEERTAFLFVFIKIEQQQSRKMACF